MLDHVSFQEIPEIRRAEDPVAVDIAPDWKLSSILRTELVQPATVFVKTVACVHDPDCAQDEYVYEEQINLIIPLELRVTGDDEPVIEICGQLDRVEPDLGIELSVFPDFAICTELPSDTLDQVVAGKTPQAAGLSVSADGSRIAARIGFEPRPSGGSQFLAAISEWQTFFNQGAIRDAWLTSDVAVVIDKGIFTERFRDFIEIEKIGLLPDGATSVAWLPAFQGGAIVAVRTPFEVPMPITCPNIDGDIYSNFELSLDTATNEMVTDISFDYDLNDFDVALCSFVGTFGAPVESIILSSLTEAVADLFVPTAAQLQQEGKVPEECDVTGDRSVTCRFPVEIPDLSFSDSGPWADIELKAGTGTADSFALEAGATVHTLSIVPHMSVSTDPIEYTLTGSCNSPQGAYRAHIDVSGVGRTCGIERRHFDPLGAYSIAEVQGNGWLPTQYRVDVNPPAQYSSAFWNAPYGLNLTVYTTGGAKTVRFSAPVRDLVAESLDPSVVTLPDCIELSEGFMGDSGTYNPTWDIDPPPYAELQQIPVAEVSQGMTVDQEPTGDSGRGGSTAPTARGATSTSTHVEQLPILEAETAQGNTRN